MITATAPDGSEWEVTDDLARARPVHDDEECDWQDMAGVRMRVGRLTPVTEAPTDG